MIAEQRSNSLSLQALAGLSMARKRSAPIPRIALTPPEAAAAIGVGEDFFTEHVRPHLRLVRRGRKVLVPVTELELWVHANAESVLREVA